MSISPAHQQPTIADALVHHRAGRLAQAEVIYRQILQQHADHPDALHLLGVIALQSAQPQVAVELIGRSTQFAPTAASLNNLGEAFRHLGRLNDAVASYQRSIQLMPQQLDAYSNLALALEAMGRHEECASALQQAAQFAGTDRLDVHDRLGAALLRAGDPFAAAAQHRKVIALAPNFAPAHANLGLALAKTNAHIDEVLAACRQALELAPDAAEAHGAMAVVLDRAARHEDAITEFQRAAALNPRVPDYYGHRGTILENLGRLDEAIAIFQEGCRNCPRDARLFSNLSSLLRKVRQYAESARAAETAIQLAPGYSEAHGNRALSLLALGDYERGFEEYEWRWRCENFTTLPREFERPMWDGSDPGGRTILVHTEQGFGDTLQFIRYVPMLAARGATVYVECHHALRKLIARVAGVSKVIPTGLALPDFDLHAPLLSLPRAFGARLDNIPADVPYLTPEPPRVDLWRERLRAKTSGHAFKVGLVWAGNAKPDAKRTVPAAQLSVLAGVPGVRFFGLQKRDAGTYSPPPPELELIDLDRELTEFNETAAAMVNLDLILTIDTAAAHLAGALGRPTWALIPISPDWRWLLDRADSPWYPTMRLFRQDREDDWTGALARVREELQDQLCR